MTTLRLGVAPHRLWADGERELDGVLEAAVFAEELGFDHVIASSHVLETEVGVTPDPLVTLSAIAGATTRIGVVTSVLILPLYNPVVLAHQTATLDRLSRGRFTLGVGTGWDRAEFDAVGVPFDGRGARADAHLARLRTLWRGEDPGLRLGVAPRTPGGPKVWVGGHSDAALRRAVRHGDAWHGSAVEPAALAQVRGRLAELADAHAERDGRAPSPTALTAGGFVVPPGFTAVGRAPGHLLGGERATALSILDELAELAETGLSSYSLWLPVPTPQLHDAMAWLADEVLAALAKPGAAPSR
ncbi:LLM class flavin-dependent oxidoreductase [Yinghuangia seranimata]|uniref:LLM class flavin-dependent oxidoreductase n=1 Tax=Yinghuangia seranimata TaxID=408067 RepID=UPI00248B3EC8|nr:LLM class flavin-dependent oxidoreductase [Yinghuangia seranimata]MDI2131072.1 LLM class flavin-dependent oxidoreductase [Yinghuangia seranimata]